MSPVKVTYQAQILGTRGDGVMVMGHVISWPILLLIFGKPFYGISFSYSIMILLETKRKVRFHVTYHKS